MREGSILGVWPGKQAQRYYVFCATPGSRNVTHEQMFRDTASPSAYLG